MSVALLFLEMNSRNNKTFVSLKFEIMFSENLITFPNFFRLWYDGAVCGSMENSTIIAISPSHVEDWLNIGVV